MTKLISRKEVFNAKFFTVVEDHLVLPNGNKRVYNNVLRESAVSIFPVDKDYNLYLIRQFRYAYKKRLIESIAGMVEGKSPFDTAIQELKEEGGIFALQWKKLAVLKIAGSVIIGNQYLYLAQDLQFGNQSLEESEEISLFKISIDEAVQKVMSGDIISSSTSTGILMVDNLRREGKL